MKIGLSGTGTVPVAERGGRVAEGYVLQIPTSTNRRAARGQGKITLTAGIVQSPLITSHEYGENYLTTHLRI